MSTAMDALERRLGHVFRSRSTLRHALTHASATRNVDRNASGNVSGNNERLEFLGDRVLNLVIAGELFSAFPEEREGQLSHRCQALVRRETLAQVARELGLDHLLVTYRGVTIGDAMLEDALEAVIGALYVDGGFDVAERFVRRLFRDRLTADVPRNAKNRLQELAMGRGLGEPRYEIVSQTGPDHALEFTVRCTVNGARKGTATETWGCGKSKRTAEQQAAERMLEVMVPQRAAA